MNSIKCFDHYQTLRNQHDLAQPFSVVGIGNFDGIHRGHQVLVQSVVNEAEKKGYVPSILTFAPHPLRFFKGDAGPRMIYLPQDKRSLMGMLGIKRILQQRFEQNFAQLSPAEFVEDVLYDAMRARCVVVGYDFAFGAGRSGTVQELERQCIQRGISIEVIRPQGGERTPFSSSMIRNLLGEGEVHQARELMGRPYHLRGIVTQGYQRGRALGFPTANLKLMSELCPAPGVYAGWLGWTDQSAPAVISIGGNPTFGQDHKLASEQQWSVEVHALGYPHGDLNLYDHEVVVWFHSRLRDVIRFPNVNALIDQIREDVVSTERSLAAASTPSWPRHER